MNAMFRKGIIMERGFTPSYRLNLINAIIELELCGGKLNHDDVQRISFLCTATREFLELNQVNYMDAIKFVESQTDGK